MKIADLLILAEDGKLTVGKSFARENTRRIFTYKSSDTKSDDWYKIESVREVKYTVHTYTARTDDMPENAFFKITKREHDRLLKAGAKLT